MSRSLSQDRRKTAKKKVKAGQGDRGDRKPVNSKARKKSIPEGMKYQPEFLSANEERALLADIETLPFREFEFRGFTGKRRTVSFGWRYDFNGGGLTRTEDMPEFLTPIRALLVTEYAPGAGIGWHKDRSVFGDVAGISLLSSCIFRLRRRTAKSFERNPLVAEPRSVYLFRSPSRTEWQHSIPGVESLRYSVTFRNVLEEGES
ncbi:alpha-ketoglutarate-dependent dioxygenase AlkB [Bradyrhizobium japonicum]|uniref:alpha-ketoglutarate-dependent dioxygenase AlkB n=1 Tax=Bradyrhizobium japonicum TaxID=375 RepID=UPI003489F091